jgi:hypothetical protein
MTGSHYIVVLTVDKVLTIQQASKNAVAYAVRVDTKLFYNYAGSKTQLQKPANKRIYACVLINSVWKLEKDL